MSTNLVTENQLDEWVRGNSVQAQGTAVELVWRLVAASSPNPKVRRFPLGDSIGQPGPDGHLNTDFGFDPFVPEGQSFWEVGTSIDARRKATEDYRDLTAAIPHMERQESTFIFVTPLSGRRDWRYTWKGDAIREWLSTRLQRSEWRDIRVIDGSGLIDWLHSFPAVQQWLAGAMGLPVLQIETPEQRWSILTRIGAPPPLSPQVFLVNRDSACEKLKAVFSGAAPQLRLDTRFRDQASDFVAACVAGMDDDARIDITGRCLIISGVDGWNAMTTLRDRHVLIADFDLDYSEGTRLLEKARRANHAVVYAGMPGGLPHPNRAAIPNPKDFQIREALEKAGYKNERARILAHKSDGNLTSLLRCLQNLSLMPEWAQGTDAAELAIAEILGGWSDSSEADRAVTEHLSKKAYGEWIGKIREISVRPGTPLIQRDGAWRMVARYEGWYVLGPRLFDEHLDRLRDTVVNVLRERDPRLELPVEERYLAGIRGKVLSHSHLLRRGLSESLALLGSHPEALASCSPGKAEATATLALRGVFEGADWALWASLNDVLPLLAEAAPREFLAAVEKALYSTPCPFDMVFAQESAGIMGVNHVTGLLWALETLAWDAEYLTRVVIVLGELAKRDPGGNWGNRPERSLSVILMPWLPQTCAPLTARHAAVAALLEELPDVGWRLLLSLLPGSYESSSGSRKPVWRELIPEDWSEAVMNRDYWQQISIYSEMAILQAKQDVAKLAGLLGRLDALPHPARDQLLAHLRSSAVLSMPQSDRLQLWDQLTSLVTKHRKHAGADWAMKPEVVDDIAAVARSLAPESPENLHRRLFSERDLDLHEEKGNYEQQQKRLEDRRKAAIREIFAHGGVEAIIAFAKTVESPWRVGFAFGETAGEAAEQNVVPSLLESETRTLTQFAGGFVVGMFRRWGWQWVDDIDSSLWTPSQKGQFLAYLPFTPDAWKRAARLLAGDESPYWSKTSANPYEAKEGLEWAVDRLLEHGRPHAAVRCLERLLHERQPVNSQQAIRVLTAMSGSQQINVAMDAHAVVDIIQALQQDPATNPDELAKVEWVLLPLLDGTRGASPRLLERRLADDPSFFCDVIRTVFRSANEERTMAEPTEHEKNISTNAYRLLHNWRTPPGSQKDGTYSGEALLGWLDCVKTACAESGHLEVALTMVGHVLIYAPRDPDGLWIHRSAAGALNDRDAGDMRTGLSTALFNSRGVHWVDPLAKEERALATKYRAQAAEVDSRGYHRLAGTLRELAHSYERDAERQAWRDGFDDLRS